MKRYTNGQDVPLGLGIALEKNNAMDYFFSLSPETQQQINSVVVNTNFLFF